MSYSEGSRPLSLKIVGKECRKNLKAMFIKLKTSTSGSGKAGAFDISDVHDSLELI